MPDAVEIETTYDTDKPFAHEIKAWLDPNARVPGRNRWVERPVTDVGELLKIAIEMGRSRPRNVGEHAIVNWLADNISGYAGPAVVVYENGKIPNMLVREGLPDDVIVVTSRTFLALASQAEFSAGQSGDELSAYPGPVALTDADLAPIIQRYVDYEITVEHAADLIGPGTAVVDVILAAKRLFGRLPDRQDAFTENEYRRALKILGLERGA